MPRAAVASNCFCCPKYKLIEEETLKNKNTYKFKNLRVIASAVCAIMAWKDLRIAVGPAA